VAIVPTATPSPISPTIPPTNTPTSTPAEPGITITRPDENTEIVMGSDIIANGLVQLTFNQTAWLSLVTYNGLLLAETQAVVSDAGWESGFNIPINVGGEVLLVATIRDTNMGVLAQSQTPITLVLDTERSDRYLALFRPVKREVAMGGFNLFFDGRAQGPVNNTVTISVWGDNCQIQVARQSFVLSGSGYWQGFVIVPLTVSGFGCAIASFGTPGEDTWREVHIPIQILANEDEGANGVTIGNPPPGSNVTAGSELLLYGTALNTSEGSVQVMILLENGRIISQNDVETDYWGYWELFTLLPFDVEGPASITVTSGDPGDGNYAQSQTLITINPAPTPSP